MSLSFVENKTQSLRSIEDGTQIMYTFVHNCVNLCYEYTCIIVKLEFPLEKVGIGIAVQSRSK